MNVAPPVRRFTLLRRKAVTLNALPLFQKVWFAPVWVLLGLSRLSILLVHFRRIAPLLGENAGNAALTPLTSVRQQERAQSIGDIVRLTSRYTPWKSNCFPQAIVARLLLGWYKVPYALYFGLSRTTPDTPMRAHAWICAGPIAVIGGRSFAQFTIVGTFVSTGLISAGHMNGPL